MNIRVLIADDHSVVREGLQALLDAAGGIEVIGLATDGREALALARSADPDIALLDLAMPNLNGIDTCQQMREECPQVRCIILSMYSTSEHVHRALRAGARGYLMKETAGRQLAAAIQAVSAGRTYLDEGFPKELVIRARDTAPGSKTPLELLSTRERQVLQLVVEGQTSTAIAEQLFLSPKTVDTYRSRLMHKLGVADLPSLVKFALNQGLTPPT